MIATSAPNTKVASAGRRNSFTPGISSYMTWNTGVYQPNMNNAVSSAATVKKRISRGERTAIKPPHVLREEEVGQAEALVPGPAAGAPEVDFRVHRAEQVGEDQR